MRVVVAEKPSVGRDLARVLGVTGKRDGWFEGNGLRITWAIGHMAELQEPDFYRPEWKRWAFDLLPILPERFEIRPRKDAADQLAVLRKLLRDPSVESVVNACDAGREGELIFRWLVELTGCNKPVSRLWISSLTDEAILDGWRRLQPGHLTDRLGDAARSRAEADWLVGMNATRALTCLARSSGGDDVMSVGRVQTPTLAMIVARDREIAAFVPETYWTVKGTFTSDAPDRPGRWDATYFAVKVADPAAPVEGEDVAPVAERVATKELAEAIAAAARGRQGRVSVAERRRVVEKPPLLYDLTSLQRRANQRYGMSAPRTLEVAQALYERHKLITYPRTDARYLTPDQVPGLRDVVAGLQPVPPYQAAADALLAGPINPGRRVVNAAEVGDHHAILPTGRTPSSDSLNPEEKRIFDLVARRLLAALGDDALFDATTLVVEVTPEAPLEVPSPLTFRARGRVCRQEGWRAIDPPGGGRDLELPPVEVDDPATAAEPEVREGQTRPPRPHNDATLLRAMETAGRGLDDEELQRQLRGCGLGTPATRASILEVLVARRYVERKGKEIVATPRGCAVIDAVPIDEMKSAELTGRWEGRLTDVAEGRGDREAFMADVRDHVERIVAAIAAAPPPAREAGQGPVIATCPGCAQPVRARGRGWGCDSGCGFTVPSAIAKRPISERMVKQLATEGKTAAFKGFRSKKGTEFTAGLEWSAEQKKVVLWFPPWEDTPQPAAPAPPGGRQEAARQPGGRQEAARQPREAAEAPRARTTRPGGPVKANAKGARKRKEPAVKVDALPPPLQVGDRCPACGDGRIMRGRAALGCDRWRDGCRFTTAAP